MLTATIRTPSKERSDIKKIFMNFLIDIQFSNNNLVWQKLLSHFGKRMVYSEIIMILQ
jgi:hypothetical protein